MSSSSRTVLPGFKLSLGFTIFYLSVIVLIPLSAAFIKSTELSWAQFWEAVSAPRVVASYKLSFGASFLAAAVNSVFGLILAWVLVRYSFPGKRIIDALVDLPFALPTAVAGIALAAIYSGKGWIGSWLEPIWRDSVTWLDTHLTFIKWSDYLGLKLAFDVPGVFIALTFIGLPFVVRTLQPVLEELEPELEEASATLGANRWQTIRRVIIPQLVPAILTGFALAFARALGEYGSVIFISGNMPMRTEIAPLMIISKLEQYDYAGATAIAVVLLVISFTLLLAINLLQKWSRRYHAV